tara:strand:+ start:838 stop:1083 length:246 start_codon:yes stop_codon:yes gene_type:complete
MESEEHIERLRFYASAPRAGAQKIHQIVDGDFVTFWLASLRGKAVALKAGHHKFGDRNQAVQHAREFRDSCQRDLERMEKS